MNVMNNFGKDFRLLFNDVSFVVTALPNNIQFT